MTPSAGRILDRDHESPKGIRRRVSKTHTPSSKASTSLMDRTNTTRTRSNYTMTTTSSTPGVGMTTFLPEMHSTPPMPTFQKPDMETPTPLRRERPREYATPSRTQGLRRPDTPRAERSIEDLFVQSARKPHVPYSTTPLIDRVPGTPPLPRNWGRRQDRAICILDASNYSLSGIVAKIRHVFPDLDGTLTPAMVDKRLRQLDQIIEIDYWAVGLAKNEKQQRREKAKLDEAEAKRLESSSMLMGGSARAAAEEAKNDRENLAKAQKKSRSKEKVSEGGRIDADMEARDPVTRGFLSSFRTQIA